MIKTQDKASSIFPNTELDYVEKTDNGWQPKTSQLHFFALHLLCSGSFSTMVAVQGCGSGAAACAVKICAQMCRRTSTAWKNILGTMPVQLQKWHQCDLARPGWLFQTSETITEWWLAAMRCQIKNQDSRQSISHLPTESWIALEN